jgi:hypothetical protein
MKNVFVAVAAMAMAGACVLVPIDTARAEDVGDLESLRREIQELRRRDADRQREIDALKGEVRRLREAAQPSAAASSAAANAGPPASAPQSSAASALDRAIGALATGPAAATTAGNAPPPSAPLTKRIGGAEMRLVDVSFDTLLAAGSSAADDHDIERLQGGGHDPNRRGFTLQQGELSLAGAVDPYFTAEAHAVFTPDDVELEEAYFTTTALPADLQLKGGYFLTEFGRLNPTHPHAWDWIDQPIVNTRMFGGEGLRSPGARHSWLAPLPWYAELLVGVQNANEGATTSSFLGDETVGGRPVVKTAVGGMKDLLYLVRWKSSFDWNASLTTQLGFSALFGPNGTGADGRTYLYGTDMVWKWQPPGSFRGWPFVTWQTELMRRDYTADRVVNGTQVDGDDLGTGLARHELNDWGLYTQLLWGFRHGWAAGVRYEYVTGSGPSEHGGRQRDFLRDDRQRVTPLIVWQPSEYSRLRLQYDFDSTDFLPGRDASSVWLGVEVLYGAHPAHQY